MTPTGWPETCPHCDRVLYPTAMLRPAPAWQWRARALFLIGAVASAFVYWAGALELIVTLRQDARLVFALWFPVALIPALVTGSMAYRIPRTARLRCSGCGWRECVLVGGRA